jgi:UMF1 family MFS transporter
MGKLMPKSKSAEFYGFFSVFEKFANVAGPLLFGVVSTIMGHSRLSIISLIIFFTVGMVLLGRVNVERGIKAAAEDESQMIASPVTA